MSTDLNDLILTELREMRNEMNDGFTELRERTATTEARIEPLFDNGQPGTITKMEQRLSSLERSRYKQAGFLAGVGLLLEPAWHYLAKKLGL